MMGFGRYQERVAIGVGVEYRFARSCFGVMSCERGGDTEGIETVSRKPVSREADREVIARGGGMGRGVKGRMER